MNEAMQLLREWIERGSEDAFATLVARHIDLVYSVALRKVGGHSGLAAEIAQTVFTDLARKARRLHAEGSLSGWLHRHTCLTAATAMRSELRRRGREQTAAIMHAIENAPSEPDWSRLAPLLDNAVNALGDADRQALLLRFFERRDLRSIGSVLGVGEDAAQKRIGRALEKLRVWLARRGVTSTSAALAAALSANGVAASPAGLAATISGAACAAMGTTSGAGTFTLLEFMTHTKAKLAVGTALATAIATPILWQENIIAKTRTENRELAAQTESFNALRSAPGQFAQRSSANDQTRAVQEREELVRLRTETSTLRGHLDRARATKQQERSRATNRGGLSLTLGTATAKLTVEEARDVGTRTGADLFQTLLWAMRTGDTNRILAIGDWTGEGGQQGMADMVREMATAKASGQLERDGKELELRVLGEMKLDDGDTALIVDFGKPTESRRIAHRIRRSGNEWRLVMGKNGPVEVPVSEELLRAL